MIGYPNNLPNLIQFVIPQSRKERRIYKTQKGDFGNHPSVSHSGFCQLFLMDQTELVRFAYRFCPVRSVQLFKDMANMGFDRIFRDK